MSEQRGNELMSVDVAIIGGGPAGLSAALCLGRARKSALVLDADNPRHAVSEGVHNFLTREGMPPAELRRVAWEQMQQYPTVQRAPRGFVTAMERDGDFWILTTGKGLQVRARAVLLATGVVDQLPDIPGLRERWGQSVNQCPFCHGWESRDKALAVLAEGEGALHMGQLLPAWSDDVIVLTNGGALSEADEQTLAHAAGVPVDRRRVVGLSGPEHELEFVHFDTGPPLARSGLFVVAGQTQIPLIQQLGVTLNDAGYVAVDMQGRTNLPMVWAAGDVTSRMQQVVEAAAQGLKAGAMITAALTMGAH